MKDNEIAGCFGKLVFGAILVIVASIVGGWILSVTWEWFIVPVFSAPTITITQAIGIGMVVNLLTSSQRATDEDEDKSWAERAIKAVVYVVLHPLIVLGIGWIVKGFL